MSTAVSPIQRFKSDLDSAIAKKEFALPDNVRPEAFRNAAIVAFQDSKYIQSCSPASLFKALRTLAASGLVPDGREAAIVPFKGVAQAMPMVYGLVKVARNSGFVQSLWAEVVYEGEKLEVEIKDGVRSFRHINVDGSEIDYMSRGGEIRGAYAVCRLADGTTDFQPMSREEIEKRRRTSANQKGDKPTDIWAMWYDEMAKKTVIRNLCKRLPMSAEARANIMAEEVSEPRDITPPERPTGPNLAQRLAGNTDEPAEEPADDLPTRDINEDVVDAVAFDQSCVFPGDAAYSAGMKAYEDGLDTGDCPYTTNPDYSNWIAGLEAATKVAGGDA